MWNGGGYSSSDDNDNAADPARLAATALAAYTTGQAAVPSQAISSGDPQQAFAYSAANPSILSTYQTQAMEALRRQEELRNQRMLAMQEQVLAETVASSSPYYSHSAFQRDTDVEDSPNDDHDEVELPHLKKKRRGRTNADVESVAEPEVALSEQDLHANEEAETVIVETDVGDSWDKRSESVHAVVAVPMVEEKVAKASTAASNAPKKKKASKKSKSPSSSKKSQPTPAGPTIDDPVPDITAEEYENIEALMIQFCKVPLLAEFSRPVSVLHPELTVYSKVVKNPIDLGQVCRGIHRRRYKSTRAIKIDMWRIFANCVKYHSHPTNKDRGVPAFISIALHLREYFNALWQEYMVPSDPPPASGGPAQHAVFEKRGTDRQKRLASAGTTLLSTRCLQKSAEAIKNFLRRGGVVDSLDEGEIIPRVDDDDADADEEDDNDILIKGLNNLSKRLQQISSTDQEYNAEHLERDVKRCYEGLFEDHAAKKISLRNRLNRVIGKILVPIYETSCRGVNQSSIWGCMAAAIWARESSKKPYWPALVLGIMAPDEQTEDWHQALTQRNEQRLPEKLRSELQSGKRKAEQALKKQNAGAADHMSFFLVEFMGTHEFIWVKESDIVETFDPDDDPNQHGHGGKKKRSSRSITDSKTFTDAIDEGRWALEEFEMQLSDTCGDLAEEDEDSQQEMNYSYHLLCQLDDDDDADGTEAAADEKEMSISDVEETNELLATDGLLDYSAEGRKNARKRAIARKKQKADAEKKEKSEQAKRAKEQKKRAKAKSDSTDTKKEKNAGSDDKGDCRDQDKRRKKRGREGSAVPKNEPRKKQAKTSLPNPKEAIHSSLEEKKARAIAIVKGYITRSVKKEDMKNLCLGGVMNIPASVVDSSGILGMGLAFRAAAGEIPMPESAEAFSKFQPWEEIDVDSPNSSAERVSRLKMQLDLLHRKLEKVKGTTKQRKEWAVKVTKRKQVIEADIFEMEKAAKHMIMRRALKRKTSSKNNDPDRAGNSAKEPISAPVDIELSELLSTEPAESLNG